MSRRFSMIAVAAVAGLAAAAAGLSLLTRPHAPAVVPASVRLVATQQQAPTPSLPHTQVADDSETTDTATEAPETPEASGVQVGHDDGPGANVDHQATGEE